MNNRELKKGGSFVDRMNAGKGRIANIDSERRIVNRRSASFSFEPKFSTFDDGVEYICNPVINSSEGWREYKIDVFFDLLRGRCECPDDDVIFEQLINLDFWWEMYRQLHGFYNDLASCEVNPENADFNRVCDFIAGIIQSRLCGIPAIKSAIKLTDSLNGKCLFYESIDNEITGCCIREVITKQRTI